MSETEEITLREKPFSRRARGRAVGRFYLSLEPKMNAEFTEGVQWQYGM